MLGASGLRQGCGDEVAGCAETTPATDPSCGQRQLPSPTLLAQLLWRPPPQPTPIFAPLSALAASSLSAGEQGERAPQGEASVRSTSLQEPQCLGPTVPVEAHNKVLLSFKIGGKKKNF